MPELRKDPVIGRWVIVAEERAKRPHDFHTPAEASPGGFCPFCEGNESKTPPEVVALRDPGGAPNGPGWRVREAEIQHRDANAAPPKFDAAHESQEVVEEIALPPEE